MEELRNILENIAEIANSEMSKDQKHSSFSYLWTKYHKLSNQLNIDLDEAHNLMDKAYDFFSEELI